jgi:hypothetical protein
VVVVVEAVVVAMAKRWVVVMEVMQPQILVEVEVEVVVMLTEAVMVEVDTPSFVSHITIWPKKGTLILAVPVVVVAAIIWLVRHTQAEMMAQTEVRIHRTLIVP